MSVKLREKDLNNGQVSLYLDLYHNKKRWYEFLDIRLNRKRPTKEDSDKYKLALEIKARREHDLIVNTHALVDKKKTRECFVHFFSEYIKVKVDNRHRTVTLNHLRKFVGNKSLPIAAVTQQWMKDFENYLLKTISVNSTLTYMQDINGMLNDLVRKGIIARNPWHAVPLHERLRRTENIRTAWTMEQLQTLVNTPQKMNPQFKQAYLFACFTGLRWSDVNGLTYSNIIKKNGADGEQWFIYFEQQKTRTIEFLPLTDQAIEILKEREVESTKNGNNVYVFPDVKETHPKTHLVHHKVHYHLKKWAQAAGLDHKKMRFHTGRHSYATNMLESTNGDLYTVSKLLGHKNVKTTQIYAQVRDKMKLAAVKSLPKLNFNRE